MEAVNLEVLVRVDYKIGFAVDGIGGHRAKIQRRKQLPSSIVGASMAVPICRLIRRKMSKFWSVYQCLRAPSNIKVRKGLSGKDEGSGN